MLTRKTLFGCVKQTKQKIALVRVQMHFWTVPNKELFSFQSPLIGLPTSLNGQGHSEQDLPEQRHFVVRTSCRRKKKTSVKHPPVSHTLTSHYQFFLPLAPPQNPWGNAGSAKQREFIALFGDFPQNDNDFSWIDPLDSTLIFLKLLLW